MSASGWHRHLLRSAGSYRRSLLFGVVVSVAQALLLVAIPWPTKLAIDNVLRRERLPGWSAWLESLPGADSSIGLLVALAAATVVLTVLHAVLEVVRRGWRRSLGLRITNDLARDTLELVQRRSLAARRS